MLCGHTVIFYICIPEVIYVLYKRLYFKSSLVSAEAEVQAEDLPKSKAPSFTKIIKERLFYEFTQTDLDGINGRIVEELESQKLYLEERARLDKNKKWLYSPKSEFYKVLVKGLKSMRRNRL